MKAGVLLVAVLLGQTATLLPTKPGQKLDADSLGTEALVRLLADSRTTARSMNAATEALAGRKDLGPKHAEALRQALEEALRVRPLATPPGERCEPGRERMGCMVTVDECFPRAGHLALALGRLGGLARPSLALLEQLADREDDSAGTAALGVLADLGSPKAEKVAVARLQSADWMCRVSGTRLLRTLPALGEQARKALVEAALEGPLDTRWNSVEAMAHRREAWCVEPLTWALASRQSMVLFNAARGLGQLGGKAGAASPDLDWLSRCHYAPPIRAEASKAVSLIGAAGAAFAAQPCPATGYTAEGYVVTGSGRTTTLKGRLPASVSPGCEAAARKLEGQPLGEVGDACLVGEDHGEFGGAIHLVVGGEARKLAEDLNPLALVLMGREVLLLDGLEHLRSMGHLSRLSRDAGKTWGLTPIAELPAFPLAWAVDGQTLLAAVRETDDSTPCSKGRGDGAKRPVFAVTPAGQVLRVPDVGARCLESP